MSKIKTTILTVLAVFAMWSCEKKVNNNLDKDKEEDKKEEKADFDFALTLSSPTDIQTIRVGDLLNIVISIKDTNPQENIVYVLKPVGKDPNKHQELNKDYYMVELKNQSIRLKDSIEIDDVSKRKSFSLQPRVPGSFQLDFEMQKYDTIQKKYIGKSVVKPFLFSVVKIKFYTTTRDRNGGKNEKRQRFYWFSIFDGENKYDNYLSNYNDVIKIEYITKQADGGGWSGEFKASKERNGESHMMEFRHSEVGKDDPPANKSNIDIKIIKYKEESDESGKKKVVEYAITYTNLNIEYSPV